VLGFLDPTSLVASSGYAAIFLLCVLQSCCVPTSSELTMGFAGVAAAGGVAHFHPSLAAVIVVGAAGELVGAYVAWIIGRTAGRGFVDRFGKYLLLTHADLDRAEGWYDRHERWGVLGSRLVPFVRNFVALPAGIAEVPLLRFGILTAIGSLIWDGAMAGIGYGVGSSWKSIMHGFSDAGYVIGAVVVLAIAFVIFHRYRAYRAETDRLAAVADPEAVSGAVRHRGTGRRDEP
jgi:membrane protein DedA with SNARE-associated domain